MLGCSRYDNDVAGRNDDYGGSDTDDGGGNVTDDDDDGDDSDPPLGSISEPGLQERAAPQVQGLRAAEVFGPPRPTYDQSLETTHARVSLSGYSHCRLTASQYRSRQKALSVKYSLRDQRGTGSIPGRVKPRTLKLLLVADPPGVCPYGFSAKSGRPGVRIM
ncbi:hypothetical protein ElyMa_004780600 [Elysia marginata]|uniref:Uncharacterized protein n=1 Tax=Elysia marginata TaxID=1093978 RepID=A0AAV4IKT4_9GAST|nr:hypothetical protein ElyMa_004780600 [Elysia marginata]